MSTEQPEEATNDSTRILGKEASELVLCYLSCPQVSEKGFQGAILLADSRTRPLHFSYVAPVRPTDLQRMLYGSTLDEHVKVDVIAAKLLDSLPKKPHVVFVDEQDLLAVRRLTKVPTAFLLRQEKRDTIGTGSGSAKYETNDDVSDQEAISEVVAALELQFDISEPFNRLKEAMREVIKNNRGG